MVIFVKEVSWEINEYHFTNVKDLFYPLNFLTDFFVSLFVCFFVCFMTTGVQLSF